MKILDKYILKSFLIPFFATFFIVMFVLVMQFLWAAFDSIAGRGIDFTYIAKFLFYTALQVTPTALSVGVLLSSIMAMGNLSEKYEIAAIKAAGISLVRFASPLVILVAFISIISFIFLNNVYPYASFRQRNLYFGMKKQKPTLALVEGGFNTDIPGYSIKFDKKYGPDKKMLKNIYILDLKSSEKNDKIIVADHGTITTKTGSKYMTLLLYDGYYYEDHTEQKTKKEEIVRMPASSVKFKTYKVNLDVSSLYGQKIDMDKYKTHYMMLSMKQLEKFSDSLKSAYDNYLEDRNKTFYQFSKAKYQLYNRYDTLPEKDSILKIIHAKAPQDLTSHLKDNRDKIVVLDKALADLKSPLNNLNVYMLNFKNKRKILNMYDFEYFYRISFSISCIILFLIGAPLGALIRKGGFGVPMVLAIILFTIYFFMNSLGKNIAEESSMTALMGASFASLIMIPLGIFLTVKAVKGTGYINFGIYTKAIKKIFTSLFDKIKIIHSKNE